MQFLYKREKSAVLSVKNAYFEVHNREYPWGIIVAVTAKQPLAFKL